MQRDQSDIQDRDSIFGMPIGSKGEESLLGRLMEYSNQGLISHIQIYINPGTDISDLGIFRGTDITKIIHAAHDDQGFCIHDGLTGVNKQIIDEAFMAADELSSPAIIFHTGSLRKRWKDYSNYERKGLDESIRKVMAYITECTLNTKSSPAPRTLFENVPKWEQGVHTLFDRPHCIFDKARHLYGFGFCLDLASAAVTATCYSSLTHAFDPPEGYTVKLPYPLESLKPPQREILNMFMKLEPEVVHTRGVNYRDVMRYPQEFTELNQLQWDFILLHCHENKIPFIIEPNNLSDYHGKLMSVTDYFDRLMEKKNHADVSSNGA